MTQFQPPTQIDAPVFALDIPEGAKGVIVYFDYKKLQPPVSQLSKGDKTIDVSEWQGDIDWEIVKDISKVNKAFVRLAHGKTPDKKAIQNLQNSKKLETRIGYHYYENEINIQEQIDTFLRMKGDNDVDFMLDIEDRYPIIDSREFDEMQMWYEKIKIESGKDGYFYTGQSVYNWDLAPEWIFQKKLFKAQYSSVCLPLSKWGYPEVWQFTSRGKIPGIADNTVDMGLVWDGETQPQKDWWFRGTTTETKVPNDETGKYLNNFFVRSNIPNMLDFFDAPHGKIIKSSLVNWDMTVQAITFDGWLKVYNDGKNDWWVRQETVKLK